LRLASTWGFDISFEERKEGSGVGCAVLIVDGEGVDSLDDGLTRDEVKGMECFVLKYHLLLASDIPWDLTAWPRWEDAHLVEKKRS